MPLRIDVLDREGMTLGFSNVAHLKLRAAETDYLSSARIPARGAIIGTWQDEDFDPYPEFLVVRDEDFHDTLAWLGSYFSALAPITQWCRVWPQSTVSQLAHHRATPTVGANLGSWIGLVVAEIAAQGANGVNLREVPGTAAMTSASFAAGRAVAVWNGQASLKEIAQRHDELSNRLREISRPISAAKMLPIWYAVSGDPVWPGAEGDRRSLELFRFLFRRIASQVASGEDAVTEALIEVRDHYDLPELMDCSRGPQLERVQALDKLAIKLLDGPRTPAVEALLGFAASLVEPGVAVLPDLLRKYASFFLTSPLWLGAFAGTWSPARVLADHQGLGRMISKYLLSELDLEGRPRCDIAYPELNRWLGVSGQSRITLRGMATRSVNVELMPGVTCPFAFDRPDASATKAEYVTPSKRTYAPSRHGSSQGSSSASLARVIEDLLDRVAKLERSGSGGPDQPDLLERDGGRKSKGKPVSRSSRRS